MEVIKSMVEALASNMFLIPMLVVGSIALFIAALRIRLIRRIVWLPIAIPPASFLAFLGVVGAPVWWPISLAVGWIVRGLRLDALLEGLLGVIGRLSGSPLLRGQREIAARARWPEAEYPYLYREVPSDLERPLWEDGKLVGGFGVETLADRHVTRTAMGSALHIGITVSVVAVVVPLLAVVLSSLWSLGMSLLLVDERPPIEQWPGQAAVAVPLGWWLAAMSEVARTVAGNVSSFAGASVMPLALFGLGTGVLTTLAVFNAWRKEKAAPYELVTKDASVRWIDRAEEREVLHEGYRRQVDLATGQLEEEPVYQLGHATGTLRTRGDLTAPTPAQPLCIDGDSLFRHMLVFGGSGEGKTTAVLKPLLRQLLAGDYGLFVCDTKGALWRDVESLARQTGREEDVVVIGTGPQMAGVDLLAGLTPTVVAATLRSLMKQMGNEATDSFWPNMGSNLIRHTLTVAQIYRLTSEGQAYRSKQNVDPYSLWWAYQAIIQPQVLDGALDACLKQLENDPSAIGEDAPLSEFKASAEYLAGAWGTMAGETKTGIVANVSQLLDGFAGHRELRERFASGGGADSISISAALEGKIVLNAISTIEGGIPARLTSILLKTILYREARLRERRLGSEECRAQPCIMVADEVQEIVTSDPSSGLSDADFWNVAPSMGLAGIFATPTVGTLIRALGEDGAENFLEQAHSKIFLRSEDRETVEYACWIAGQHERARVCEDGHRESLEQRQLLDGWTPVAAVDETESIPTTWHSPIRAAVALLDAEVAAFAGAKPRRTYSAGTRLAARAQRGWSGILQMLREAVWRSGGLESHHLMHGSEVRPALAPHDVMSMGRWHAFAHLQRAGAARQDVIVLSHDFD